MTDYLTIVRAVYGGLSQRQAATTYHVSRNTVSLLIRHAKNQGWLTVEDLSRADATAFSPALLKPVDSVRDTTFRMPDFEHVHAELAKPHVTLKLLWEEYVESCRIGEERFYMETQFRRYYHKFARIHKATIRLEHKPALSMEVDWAGTKIAFFDPESGKMAEAALFVSVLPCSQLIYAEPFRDEKLHSWIAGHVNAFKYFEGVPKTLIPDNLKSSVKRPNFYEPELNKTYLEMSGHYGSVVLPARVRKPKDKSSVENSVLIASRKILAKLRNVQILSFADLQSLIRSALKQVNEAPLTGKSGSRWSTYLAEEKEYMLPLPEFPYEMAQWGKAKVQPNCHIAFQRKFYSVPFEYLGEEADVRATQSTVEIFYHHQRIASHKRLWGKADYSTIQEHMPPDKLFFSDWNRSRFLSWAEKTGDAARKVVEAILDRAVIEQQAYRSCFGLLNLQNKYGPQRLERACCLILTRTLSPTYQQIKNILEKNMDAAEQPGTKRKEHPSVKRGFQRGATYFGGDAND